MIDRICISRSLRSKSNFPYWQIPHLQSCPVAKMCFQVSKSRLVALSWPFVETRQVKNFWVAWGRVPRGEWKCFLTSIYDSLKDKGVFFPKPLPIDAVHGWIYCWKCPQVVHKCSLAFLPVGLWHLGSTRVLEKVCTGMSYSVLV